MGTKSNQNSTQNNELKVATKLSNIADRVSPRKLAKPGGRLEGRPTGDEACSFFCDRGLTQASNCLMAALQIHDIAEFRVVPYCLALKLGSVIMFGNTFYHTG